MNKIKKRKAAVKPVILEQWIEVKRKDGRTLSLFFPTNEEFEKLRLEMQPPPELIYRRINFVHGIPGEYSWTEPDRASALYGGLFLHRMLASDWPEIMQQESQMPDHHVIPAAYAIARPECFGPCPCAACKADPDRLNRYG